MKNNKIDQQIRLPQINNNKLQNCLLKESNNHSRVRPNSSSKLNDLQKNLFFQLEQYDSIGRKTNKNHKNKQDGYPTSTKEVSSPWVDLDPPYLKKLEKSTQLATQLSQKPTSN
jgi:hypothetical protein